MKIFTLILTIFISILFVIVATGVYGYYSRETSLSHDETVEMDLYEKILDGTSVAPASIKVDYTDKYIIGSPLVFGGSHVPSLNQADAWTKIADAGITFVRNDFYTGDVIDKNITLDQYKANSNNIQDISKWNISVLEMVKGGYHEAKLHGMKVMGILSYAPPWLTYSNTKFGVPRDWDIYEDIVKKTYRYYRDDLDFVEIWNEPNYFKYLDVTNSSMTQEAAYKEIFLHATKAIEDVDREKKDGKRVQIVAPSGYNPIKTTTLNALLSEEKLAKKIDIVSYHNYDHLPEPAWNLYKEVLNVHDKGNLPIMVTEWNMAIDGEVGAANSPIAISYTADKLVHFLKMGVLGANYHSLDSLGLNGEKFGFYTWDGSRANLLPQAKTWILMSKTLSLGNGKSKIYPIDSVEQINSMGFINDKGEHGLVVVNKSNEEQLISIKLKNTGISRYAKLKIYIASEENMPNSPVEDKLIKLSNEMVNTYYFIPKKSVMGAVILQEKEWYDLFLPH